MCKSFWWLELAEMIHGKEAKLLLCVFLTASMQNAGDKVQLDLWISGIWTCIAEGAGG